MTDNTDGVLARVSGAASPGPQGIGRSACPPPGPVGLAPLKSPGPAQVASDTPAAQPPAETKTEVAPPKDLRAGLECQLGQGVADFCDKYGKAGDAINHCAHYVSHALEIRMRGAALCSNVGEGLTNWGYSNRRKGFCVRVDQVFNSCKNRKYWSDSKSTDNCLAVVTIPANIKTKIPLTVGSMSKKHIGIFAGGMVYHYSNSQDRVVKQTPEQFSKHYGGDTVMLRSDLP